MGPFDPDRQVARARACERIQRETDRTEVREMWQRIQASLAHSETEYQARVRAWYTTHREIIQ